MHQYVIPAAFALFIWWFSTGAIIYLDGLPRRTFKWSMLGASAVLLACLWGLHDTAGRTTVGAAYLAFFYGLFAWGWQEISFYMGYVTGPRRAPCPENCAGWRHFGHAVQTSLWHELAIIATAGLVVALTWGQPNQIGTWTFMVLWWMHQSAKLNVFLGVRNLNEEFLPEHLTFLKSFLRKRPMNLLFPFSITISTVIAVLMFQRATAAPTAFARVGGMFLGTMMSLAILEHWFLVLPLPAARLWKWSLRSRAPARPFAVEIVAGFLGAGKTTFMRRRLAMLAEQPAATREKTVVLVNDFATVGIDGSLLRGQGADVVELPNGCICCSLRDDLATQLEEVVARFAPDRVLIEPSGVADLASLIGVIQRPTIAGFVRDLRVITLIDAGAFLADFAEMQAHLTVQARLASLVVINKTDLVSPTERLLVEATLHRLSPETRLVTACYGAVPPDALTPRPAPDAAHPHDHEHDHHAHEHHDHAPDHAHHHDAAHGHHDHDDHEHDHDHDHEHHEHDHGAAAGFVSWHGTLGPLCDAEAIGRVIEAAARGTFGPVARLKGLARVGRGWIQFDVAGHHASMAAFAAAEGEAPRVVAIGRDLDEPGLAAAFAGCELHLAT